MLTKEECSLLLALRCHNCKHQFTCNDCLINKKLEQLINEHFDNPPLTLDELDRMQDEPIWDDWAKEWLIFNWNCDSLECLLCRDSLGNWLHLDFEENRFYRKQVQADE